MSEFFQQILGTFELPLTNPVLVFSLILFIILLSPILLRRLNIPGIIGLIISGVIIGPYGLNILENNSAIELFSTIGLLYIMFIAGLELDLKEFKVNKYKSLLFGFFTFTFPLLIGFPVSYYLLNYDMNASLLIASMFATHTLVAYPIVSKLGVSKNQAVAITVGGTILTDTAVLVLLAIVTGSQEGELNQEFWIRLGLSMLAFLIIMFVIIPRITKWFFKKLESEKHAHYIFVLAVVFFAAFLAEVAGLEPIIGAFVAGLALNSQIPHSSALMNRIEFIGNSLFIPFFLISVGMLVDVKVIFQGPFALIIAATLTSVALFGKWIAALFTQISFRYTKTQRNLIFGLSSSHAAATLAVILVGFRAKILDENVLNGTIILILITCIVASFVTEKAAKRIVLEEDYEISSDTEFKNRKNEQILVPIANVSNFENLLELALIIKNKKSQNPVTILSVVPNDAIAENNLLKTRKKLEDFVRLGAAAEIDINALATIDVNPVGGIARTSREIMANIIVLGWPKKASIIDKLVGVKIQSIIDNVGKNLFICNINIPLLDHKKIVLITPPLSEKESGYTMWLEKILRLSQELHIPIVQYGMPETQKSIQKEILKARISVSVTYHHLDNWEDLLSLSRKINDKDLIILVSARKGSVSFMNIMDNLPLKLEKYFSSNNKIIIYPQQHSQYHQNKNYEDLSSAPLTWGVEAIEHLSKGIGNIFKKD